MPLNCGTPILPPTPPGPAGAVLGRAWGCGCEVGCVLEWAVLAVVGREVMAVVGRASWAPDLY